MRKISDELRHFIEDNFDIKQYKACSELDVTGWYFVLSMRYGLAPPPNGKYSAEASSLITQNFFAPLPTTNWNEIITSGPTTKSIFGLDEIGWIDERKDVIAKHPHLAQVLVDLNATDQQIIADFSKWLTNKRAEANTTDINNYYSDEKITIKSIHEWSTSRVLAYIDLTNYASLRESFIPNHLMGDLLYPDQFDINLAERVRKKIKPLANKLQNAQFLSALELTAMKDFQEKTEKKSI